MRLGLLLALALVLLTGCSRGEVFHHEAYVFGTRVDVAVHGDSLSTVASSPARLTAFNEAFLMLTALCVLAMLAAWQLRAPATDAAPQQQSGQ